MPLRESRKAAGESGLCGLSSARGYRTARQRCLPGEGLHSSLMTANVQRSEGTVQTTQTALLLTTSQGDTKILGSWSHSLFMCAVASPQLCPITTDG